MELFHCGPSCSVAVRLFSIGPSLVALMVLSAGARRIAAAVCKCLAVKSCHPPLPAQASLVPAAQHSRCLQLPACYSWLTSLHLCHFALVHLRPPAPTPPSPGRPAMNPLLPFVKQPKVTSSQARSADAGTYTEADMDETAMQPRQQQGGLGGMFSKLRRQPPVPAPLPLPGQRQPTGPITGGRKKLVPGRPLPKVRLHTVQGGVIEVGSPTGKWQLIVVYRGKHDPVSRNYLASLHQLNYELEEMGCEVLAVSADSREKAEAFLESLRATAEAKEISFRIAHGLTVPQMRMWGLYISKPRNTREAEHPFPEPATFLVTPDGEIHIVEYSNSPFARPDLRILIEGIRYIEENDYPVRGTYGLTEV